MNIMTESSWRRKGFIFRYILELAMKGRQVKNWSRDHEWEHIPGFLSMAYSTCFLMWTRVTCSAIAPPTIGWALWHQLLIKNMPHPYLTTGQSDGSIFFFHWGSFFPNDSGLCQGDRNWSAQESSLSWNLPLLTAGIKCGTCLFRHSAWNEVTVGEFVHLSPAAH